MGKTVESPRGSFFSPSSQTSFTMRNTAQPFGQPQYMVACVTTATISSRLTPFVLASMAVWSHTSPNSTPSFRCAKGGAIAPAPLWYLTSLIVEHMPGALVSSQMVGDEADVGRALFDSLIDLAVCMREVPGMRSVLLMRENLYLSAPEDHPLAQRKSVSFADLDGETFLLFGGIGFWRGVHRRMTPHAHVVVQEDREVWRQIMRATRMLGFSSDAPVLMRPDIAAVALGAGALAAGLAIALRRRTN